MKETNENRKDNLISTGVSVSAMILIIVLLITFGLKSQIPPPPPKKTFYVDIEQIAGGGGGGGAEVPSPKTSNVPTAQNYATQNAQHDAPSVSKAPKTSTNPTPAAPKVDQTAMYKGGRGGSGSGGGTGSGLGPGTGSGSGGGIGYGTGSRGLINNINTTVYEEGQVCVEVHVMADGSVSEAHVINNKKYQTTITNRMVQNQCVNEAKRARYKSGKEELRVIIFK